MKDNVCRHLRALGFTAKESARYASLIEKWIRSSGKEWTVKRMKSALEALKSNLATGIYNIPDGWATKTNRNGEKIVADGLIHSLLVAKQPGEIEKASAFFRMYTLISITKKGKDDKVHPTETQLNKFNEAVLGEIYEDFDPSQINQLSEIFVIITRGLRESLSKIRASDISYAPLVYWAPSDKTSPYLDECPAEYYSGVTYKDQSPPSVLERSDVRTKSVFLLQAHPKLNKLWYDYPLHVSDCIVGIGTYLPPSTMPLEDDNEIPVGTISFLQEPACKCRVVANPALVVQALGEPLKRKLQEISKRTPGVYTFDQESGRKLVSSWLDQELTCYAYDVSSFTDRFPAKLQYELLKSYLEVGLINEFDLKVFDVCSKLGYYSDEHKKILHYETGGQPQGWGPSFHAAALTHANVARACQLIEDSLVQDNISTKPCYAVIGDDIVISNPKVAHRYIEMMRKLGVQINAEKSIISDRITEFAGKLITSDSIIDSIKLTPGTKTADQYVKLLEFYPPGYWLQLTNDERRRAIKAILPGSLGGIRFQIPGKSHKEMFGYVDWDKIRSKTMQKGLEQTLGAYSHASLQKSIEFIHKSLEQINTTNISHSEWENFASLCGYESFHSEKISLITGMFYRDQDPPKEEVRQSPALSSLQKLIISAIYSDYYSEQFSKQTDTVKEKFDKFWTSDKHPSWRWDEIRPTIPFDYMKYYVTESGYEIECFTSHVKQVIGQVPYNMSETDIAKIKRKNNNDESNKTIDRGYSKYLRDDAIKSTSTCEITSDPCSGGGQGQEPSQKVKSKTRKEKKSWQIDK